MSRRSPYGTPFEIWRNWVGLASLAAEAQAVIALRLWGMAGLWAVAPGESHRMVSEKLPAFAEAAQAAAMASLSGRSQAQVLSASLRPLRRRTKSNVKRLAKRGPRNPRLPRG
ncbi:antifreeze protein [Aquicoccus sp. SCR17]|nr:antifreeze protein [Carideicomes alvinocaridis]